MSSPTPPLAPSPPPPPASTSASSSQHLPRQPKPPKAPKQPKPKPTPTRSSKLRGNPSESHSARVSKTVTYLLRHGAEKQGLGMDGEGWCAVDELLEHPALSSNGLHDLEGLQAIVKGDRKTRLALEKKQRGAEGEGVWYVRANQGHSIELGEVEGSLRRVEREEEGGEAVHGTTGLEAWRGIYKTGLSKMKRQHIHLALSTPPSPSSSTTTTPPSTDPSSSSSSSNPPPSTDIKQTSGIRSSSTHLIYLDVPLLLARNVPLFLSANDVLLSPGDPANAKDGVIGREFFLRCVERKSGKVVWERGVTEGDGTS